jgi:hypothetical protein
MALTSSPMRRGDQDMGVRHDPVFKVGLRQIALRVGQIVALQAAHFIEDRRDS